MMIGMVANNEHDRNVSSVILIVGVVSMIPCLYVGCKPTEN